MNNSHMFYEGRVLGMTDDGLMAYSSLVFGLFAAYQWRREAQIASLIAYAAVCSYAEHILRYELLTWLDRAAAVSLAIVLVRRVGFIPRRCHLAVAALLWATCDILYGNLSRPLYVSLHTCGQRRNHPVVRASSTLRDCTRRDATQALARMYMDLRRRPPPRLVIYLYPASANILSRLPRNLSSSRNADCFCLNTPLSTNSNSDIFADRALSGWGIPP